MSEEKLDIVFTCPHPTTSKSAWGGTIALCVQQGYRVGMVHMTTGEPTPRGTLETRRKSPRPPPKYSERTFA